MADVDDQLAILAAYAAGDTIPTIVADLDLPRTLVTDTVDTWCGYDRTRAAAVVDDPRILTENLPTDPAPPPAEPAAEPETPPAPEPAAPAPKRDLYDVLAQPEPAAPRSFDELLDAADQCGNPAAADLANQILRAVDDLAHLLDAARAEAAARARVDQLRAELAAAEQELGRLAAAAGSSIPKLGSVDRVAVRAWAADHNMTCPAKGPIPKHILSAYLADRPTVEKGQS